MTPLHAACLSGNIAAVDLLLDWQDVDFMKKDKVGLYHMFIFNRETSFRSTTQ